MPIRPGASVSTPATQDEDEESTMPTATHGEARINVAAAPDRVYELVTDITRMGDWSPECYQCDWLEGATGAVVGARFRGHNRLGFYRWQTTAIVTVADPGREFAFTVVHDNGREETRWCYQFAPTSSGTALTESYRFLWCPISNRIGELFVPRNHQLRRGLQQTVERIKSAAEGAEPEP